MKKRILFLFLPVVVACGAAVWILGTPSGGELAVRTVSAYYLGPDSIEYNDASGRLSGTFSLHDVRIDDTRFLAVSDQWEIQRADIRLKISGIWLNVFNGTLKLPHSRRILFYGSYEESVLDLTVYAPRVGLVDLFPGKDGGLALSGTLEEFNIHAAGQLPRVILSGNGSVLRAEYENFTAQDIPLAYTLETDTEKNRVEGKVDIKGGRITGPNNVSFGLKPSRCTFTGDPADPALYIKAVTDIEGIKIHLSLTGTVRAPQMELSSVPHLPPQHLLVMLVTGKRWKATEQGFQEGEVTPEMVGEFVDYFMLGGEAEKLGNRLGIKEFSVELQGETRALEIKKEVTPGAAVKYRVEQENFEEETPETKHTIGGEVEISDGVSVGAEKEIRQPAETPAEEAREEGEGKIYFRYKKEF
ncbi:MAG: hypothetical protein GF333_01240 [Candidatus Omnitrophica bacterium]|nr:hypothetical protein [Candidatus Omnitrophota bacterium]